MIEKIATIEACARRETTQHNHSRADAADCPPYVGAPSWYVGQAPYEDPRLARVFSYM
jgi:hypothetical protein